MRFPITLLPRLGGGYWFSKPVGREPRELHTHATRGPSLGRAHDTLQRDIARRWPGARPVLGRFAPPFDALEAAAQTGRLVIRTGAIAREIEVNESGHILGVVWIDQQTRSEERARAPLVFL